VTATVTSDRLHPLLLNREYRIVTLANNFFATKATPGFTAVFGARDQDRSLFNGGDALWRYLEAHSPVSAPELDRMGSKRPGDR
jgi:5'-nucleotidase